MSEVAMKIIRRRGKPQNTVYQSDEDTKIEAIRTREPKPHTPSLPEKIAGHDMFFKNWHFPNAGKYFEHQPWLRSVDRYFPHALGGPLYMDIAETDQDLKTLEAKEILLKGLGLRYLILKPKMTFNEAMDELGR